MVSVYAQLGPIGRLQWQEKDMHFRTARPVGRVDLGLPEDHVRLSSRLPTGALPARDPDRGLGA